MDIIEIKFETILSALVENDTHKDCLRNEYTKFLKTLEKGRYVLYHITKENLKQISPTQKNEIKNKYGIPIILINKYSSDLVQKIENSEKLSTSINTINKPRWI